MPKADLSRRIDVETYNKVHALIGLRPEDISSDAGTAINCAWDMGYRRPDDIAAMARRLMDIPAR